MCIVKSREAPYQTGIARDKKVKEIYMQIFWAKSDIYKVKCNDCDKPQVVFDENYEVRKEIIKIINIEYEYKPYLYTYLLIIDTPSEVYGEVYLWEKSTCRSNI